MTEKPLLILPEPTVPEARDEKQPPHEKYKFPSIKQQAKRIAPKFQELQNVLNQRSAHLKAEMTGVMPEAVIVLETVGSVDKFISAVQKIDGLEWLTEIDEEDIPPDEDFFEADKHGIPKEKKLSGRMYLVFSNQEALKQILSLWDRWQSGKPLDHGYKKWATLFIHLRDVRIWGIKDRLHNTGILEDWEDRISHGSEIIPCEIELWHRANADALKISSQRVKKLVHKLNGKILNECIIDEIRYHALLGELPAEAVKTIIKNRLDEVDLIHCEQIQFFRAAGQMSCVIDLDETTEDEGMEDLPPPYSEEPIIALFDGLPLQNHERLKDRLIIDDPDSFEDGYEARSRTHGTSMASLILHGDLDADEPCLSKKLYVRPILRPDPRDWLNNPPRETVPQNRLVVDLIHRAVTRMFDGEGDQEPTASDVCIINLSLGIIDRPFDNAMSPLGRLLDWLSWKYQVLFVVSAGNYPQFIDTEKSHEEWQTLSSEQMQSEILRIIAADARNRRLLSPAEAMNIITVGAIHADASSENQIPRSIDPYPSPNMPCIITAQGMGYRRAIKPEVFAPGGKAVLIENIISQPRKVFTIYSGSLAPGQRVACPGSTPGDVRKCAYTRGTSNATALISRAGAFVYDVLNEMRGAPGAEIIDEIPVSIWIKALLTHSAEWGPAFEILEDSLKNSQNSRRFKEYITRLIGYGTIAVDRVMSCSDFRATAIGGGHLAADQAHIHSYPLPPSLSGRTGRRRLTITQAWLTPVNPKHRSWRRAQLWFTPPKEPLKGAARCQAQWQAVKRGTLQHEILEGEKADVFVDGDVLEIKVNCSADAGELDEDIPYAIIATLEVAEEIGVPIYDEIRARIRDRIKISARP